MYSAESAHFFRLIQRSPLSASDWDSHAESALLESFGAELEGLSMPDAWAADFFVIVVAVAVFLRVTLPRRPKQQRGERWECGASD
jgi:hypothetical protein